MALNAQNAEVTIGNGASSGNLAPFNTYYENSTTEMLYLASEIGTAGQIESVAWDVESNSSLAYTELNIYMGTTTASSLSSGFTNFDELQLVYSSTNGIIGDEEGWETFTLQHPFYYDGADNLVVVVCRQSDDYTGSLKYYYAVAAGRIRYYRRDGDATAGELNNAVSGVAGNNLPNMQLSINTSASAPCARPASIAMSNLTANSVDIAFTAGGSETSWYATITPAADGVSSLNLSTTSFSLANLTPNTTYQVAVSSICSAGDTSAPRALTFATPCVAQDIPYLEDFESYDAASTAPISACWHKGTDGSNYPYPTANNSHDGSTRSLYFAGGSTTYSYAALPLLTEPINTLMLTFKAFKTSANNGYIQIGTMSNPSDIATFHPYDTVWVSELNTWEEFDVAFNQYSGSDQYIAIVVRGGRTNGYQNVYVDDVLADYIPSCIKPVGMMAIESETTHNSATFSWTERSSASQWIITYTDGENVYNEIASTNPYTIYGLDANTPYTASVRSICSAGDTSSASNLASVRTQCYGSVNIPYVMNFDEFATGDMPYCWDLVATGTNGSITYPRCYSYAYTAHSGALALRFESNAADTEIAALPEMDDIASLELSFWVRNVASNVPVLEYGVMEDSLFVSVGTISLTNTYTDQHVSFGSYTGSGSRIAFRTSSDTAATYTVYIDDINVTEAPSCPRPTNAAVAEVTGRTATISWSAGAYESAWQIQYRLSSDTAWNIVMATDTTFTLTNLNPDANYVAQVRAYCSETEQSPWPESNLSFHTNCAPNTLPWQADFANGFGNCWNIYEGLIDPVLAGTASLNSTNGTWSYNNNVFADRHPKLNIYGTARKHWLVTPEIEFQGDASLNFDVATSAFGSAEPAARIGNDDRFVVLMLSHDTVWTILRQWGADASRDDDSLTSITNTPAHFSLPVSNIDGQTVRFAFYGESTVGGNGDFDLHIANIMVTSVAPDSITVTATSADAAMGTVTGSGRYAVGSTVTISAIANEGYHFAQWNDHDTNATRTFVAAADVAFTATFEADAAVEPTYVVMNSYNANYFAEDGEWSIELDGTDYFFAFGITADEIENGHTYTLADLVASDSYGLDNDTYDQIHYASVQYTQTLANGTLNVHALVSATNGTLYDITYTGTVETTLDTVRLAMASYREAANSLGMVEELSNASYRFSFIFATTPANGVAYTYEDMLDVSAIDLSNGDMFYAEDAAFVKNLEGRTLTISATMQTEETLYILSYTQTLAPDSVTVSVVSSDTLMGTVTGSGRYEEGSTVTISAIANEGYHFVEWNDHDTLATRTIVATADTLFTAIFAANPVIPDSVNITVLSADETMGTVSGTGRYEVGESVTISAIANNGYRFVAWNDGNTSATRTITATDDATYTATFEEIPTEGISELEKANIQITARNLGITLKGAEGQMLRIFDLQGRLIVSEKCIDGHTYTMPATGIYMVKVASYPAQKVVVVR